MSKKWVLVVSFLGMAPGLFTIFSDWSGTVEIAKASIVPLTQVVLFGIGVGVVAAIAAALMVWSREWSRQHA